MKKLFFLSLVIFASGCQQEETLSVLIKNVKIVDGSGNDSFDGAVRILDEKILEIGQLEAKKGERIIDGGGKILAPGFIDTHSHHDGSLFEKRSVPEVVSQGVTTIIIGQDGGSHYPLQDFWNQLDSLPVAVNVGSYVGHNTLRRIAMQDFKRHANEVEIERMKEMLVTELSAGGIGLSSGLEYDPGIYSNRNEILELAQVLAQQQKRYISHIRSEDRYLWDAIDEIIDLGRQTGIPVQVSHMKIAIVSQWGKADSLIQVLNNARKEGIDITADVYPYAYWQSTMTVLFPERNFEDIEAAKFALTELTTPEGMIISAYGPDPSYIGKSLAEIAQSKQQSPEVTYLDLINTSIDQGARESVICTSMSEEDITKLISWEWANICSDGALNGRHPRGAGSFTKVLRKYVRENKSINLPQAIKTMTSQAAQNIGLENRGLIRDGYFADLVLFDPESVKDNATIENPDHLSEGILKVWVNGQEVWSENEITRNFPGRQIK